MKQFFLFLTLCCLIGPLSHALDFEGKVTDAKTGLGVNGIMVTVVDSGGQLIGRRATNALGDYSIPYSTPIIGGIYKVSIPAACGVPQTIIVSYSGATPIRTDFNVCQGALPYQIQGQVKLKGNNNGRVKLELLSIGTTAGSTDSVATVMHTFNTANGTNGSFSTQLPAIPAGRLILKATLEPGHINYGAYLPTYYSSATSWSTAKPVTNNTFISDTSNIIMVDTVRTVGAGCISGFARSGPNPLSDKIIILLNGGNAAVGFAYTDGSGRFSFNNLGLGTYKIYGDVVPKLNPTLTLTLTATKPCISDLLFEETSTSFSARIGVLAVGSNGSLLDQLTLSPNPVQQSLSIPGAEKIAGSKQLSVRDLSGRIIATEEFKAGENLRLNTAMWPSGMYFLQLRTTIGTQSYRISKL